MGDFTTFGQQEWDFEPLSPNGPALDGLLDTEDLLDEALMILAHEEGSNGRRRAGFISNQMDQEILASLAEDIDHEDMKAGNNIFLGDELGEIKRAFSPIKTMMYDDSRYEYNDQPKSKSGFDNLFGSSYRQQSNGMSSEFQLNSHSEHESLSGLYQPLAKMPPQYSGYYNDSQQHRLTDSFGQSMNTGYSIDSKKGQLVRNNHSRNNSTNRGGQLKPNIRIPGSLQSSLSGRGSETYLKPTSSTNQNPWPSAKEYAAIIKSFLDDHTLYTKYTIAELGRCKLTGTPMQPEWLYTKPRPGMYFIECESLRGKGSFGFPKCESIGKKRFEWKKTSYVNNVPKAKPVVSYITANGNGKDPNGVYTSYRMRIVKPLNLESSYSQIAGKWCLVDIHRSTGLARRNGPRPQKKSVVPTSTTTQASISKTQDKSIKNETFTTVNESEKASNPPQSFSSKSKPGLALNTSVPMSPRVYSSVHGGGTIPLSPLKRLSLTSGDIPTASHDVGPVFVGSPKGKKIQRINDNEE